MITITLQPIAAAALRNLIRRRLKEIEAGLESLAAGEGVVRATATELREEAALLRQGLEAIYQQLGN